MPDPTSRDTASELEELLELPEAPPPGQGVDANRSGSKYRARSSKRRFRGAMREREHRVEVLSSILLAVTTVLTAWSAYQATRWNGVQSASYASASSLRVESTRSYNFGMQQYVLDTNTFNLWVAAHAMENTALAEFYKNNVMRLEFVPFLDLWAASHPADSLVTNPPERSPFADEDYLAMLFDPSRNLEAQAEEFFDQAGDAGEHGDDYILNTVFFASVLFFAGIATKFRSLNVRVAMLGAGSVVLIYGLYMLIDLPIQ